jgi:hypothetical protein
MHPQQAAPQSAPHAAPDPQARWHDPHGGTHHPAYDPGYSALDQAVDVPHRPSPGPGYVPVDPVSRGYQDPRGPQPAHGWAEPGPGEPPPAPHPARQYAPAPQYGQAAGGYAGAPRATPMPQAQGEPGVEARRPGSPAGSRTSNLADSLPTSLPPWLRGAAVTIAAAAGSAMAALGGGIATLRTRRAEKAAARAREDAAQGGDVYDDGVPADVAGIHAPRQRAPAQKLTAKEKRWQRRRRRHVVEEVIGWILVPVILIALYFALIGGLAIFGLSLDDLMEGLRVIRAQFG